MEIQEGCLIVTDYGTYRVDEVRGDLLFVTRYEMGRFTYFTTMTRSLVNLVIEVDAPTTDKLIALVQDLRQHDAPWDSSVFADAYRKQFGDVDAASIDIEWGKDYCNCWFVAVPMPGLTGIMIDPDDGSFTIGFDDGSMLFDDDM